MKKRKKIFILMIIITLLLSSTIIRADFSIILNFDDGYEGVFKNAYPIMQEYNIPGVVFVISNRINRIKHLSVDQLKILKNSGWEIGSHTVCHYDLTKVIPSVLIHEIKGSKEHLKELGLLDNSYASFASPNSKWNSKIENLVSNTYQLARGNNLYLFKKDEIYIENTIQKVIIKNTTLNQIKCWIKEAKAKNQLLILIFHEIAEGGNEYFYSPNKFKELIRFINNYDTTTFKRYYF